MYIKASKEFSVNTSINGVVISTEKEIKEVTITIDNITLTEGGEAIVNSKVSFGDISLFGSVQTFQFDKSKTTIYEQAYQALLEDETLIDATIVN